jgi:arylformamidase
MAVDSLENEYSPRLSVPDCETIFARWAREAEDYRDETFKADHAELGLSYGDTPRQFVDLFLPEAGENAPLALFVHGGYWRATDPSLYSHLARGLNGRGFAVAMAGYDLCPVVTIGDIVEQIRRACIFLYARFGKRMLVIGHSAGGHLAASMVATDWPTLYPKAPADLVPAGYAISGLFDLTPMPGFAVNQDLRLSADDARRLSPIFSLVPPGRALDAAVGDLETNAFKQQSRAMAQAWQAKALTRYAEFPGNHFTVIEALNDPQSGMVSRAVELARPISP